MSAPSGFSWSLKHLHNNHSDSAPPASPWRKYCETCQRVKEQHNIDNTETPEKALLLRLFWSKLSTDVGNSQTYTHTHVFLREWSITAEDDVPPSVVLAWSVLVKSAVEYLHSWCWAWSNTPFQMVFVPHLWSSRLASNWQELPMKHPMGQMSAKRLNDVANSPKFPQRLGWRMSLWHHVWLW